MIAPKIIIEKGIVIAVYFVIMLCVIEIFAEHLPIKILRKPYIKVLTDAMFWKIDLHNRNSNLLYEQLKSLKKQK